MSLVKSRISIILLEMNKKFIVNRKANSSCQQSEFKIMHANSGYSSNKNATLNEVEKKEKFHIFNNYSSISRI